MDAPNRSQVSVERFVRRLSVRLRPAFVAVKAARIAKVAKAAGVPALLRIIWPDHVK